MAVRVAALQPPTRYQSAIALVDIVTISTPTAQLCNVGLAIRGGQSLPTFEFEGDAESVLYTVLSFLDW